MRVAAFALVLLCLPAVAGAHRLAPTYLEITERDGGFAQVVWKTPRLVARGTRIEPVLPCPHASEIAIEFEPSARVARWTLDCGSGLVGLTVGADGLAGSGSDALVRVALSDGREMRAILTAEDARFEIPERESSTEVAVSYLELGVEHLFSGLDHVAFVIGLLVLLGTSRSLLIAITSFTLGHSLTLAIAGLGVLRLPPGLVEILIAGTLVAIARELATPAGRATSLLSRHPGYMPFSFGLLHGLGFAGALSEVGLPQQLIPLALLSFNVGIELAQLAIVALALPAIVLATRLRDWPRALAELPSTLIGSLGVYWGLARTFDWLWG